MSSGGCPQALVFRAAPGKRVLHLNGGTFSGRFSVSSKRGESLSVDLWDRLIAIEEACPSLISVSEGELVLEGLESRFVVVRLTAVELVPLLDDAQSLPLERLTREVNNLVRVTLVETLAAVDGLLSREGHVLSVLRDIVCSDRGFSEIRRSRRVFLARKACRRKKFGGSRYSRRHASFPGTCGDGRFSGSVAWIATDLCESDDR